MNAKPGLFCEEDENEARAARIQDADATEVQPGSGAQLRSRARLLLVEDDAILAAQTTSVLEHEGYAVDVAVNCRRAATMIHELRYDAAILDLTLPDGDGLDLLKRWRATEISLPVIALTARGGLEDKVRGLEAGADDYVAKPFEMRELLARVRALLRRPGGALGLVLSLSNLELDTVRRRLTIGGRRLNVPRRELAILELLMRRAESVVDRDSVMRAAYAADEFTSSNVLETNISRLRQRLAEFGAGVEIRTIRGVGYILRELP